MTKRDDLVDALKQGWASTTHLQALMHWKAPTLRGVLSDLSRNGGQKIERKREDGITSYRIVAREQSERPS